MASVGFARAKSKINIETERSRQHRFKFIRRISRKLQKTAVVCMKADARDTSAIDRQPEPKPADWEGHQHIRFRRLKTRREKSRRVNIEIL
jgi:hypothetical protein